MKLLANVTRRGRRIGSFGLLLVGLLAMGTASELSYSQNPEKVQASYVQDGNAVNVTLTIYQYTTPLEKHILSVAFDERQDEGLAVALSKTRAAGICSLTGNINLDVAFIESVVTSTGRQITFIASRPLQSNEVNPSPESKSFDLLVGQFDINDNDGAKSTGFLYPASKLALDEQGKLHYDLSGNPWPLVNIFDSNWTPVMAERRVPDGVSTPASQP